MICSKKPKIDDQEPDLPSSSPSTETVIRFIPPETSNLLSTADSSSSGNVDSNTTYAAHVGEVSTIVPRIYILSYSYNHVPLF